MINIQNFKNAVLVGDIIVCLVDDTNEDYSFGYTDSIEKVQYNFNLLKKVYNLESFDSLLKDSKEGLTSLYPFGRYILISQIKKDKSAMKMYFFDHRVEYSIVDKGFEGIFSDKIKLEFKRVKYEIEEHFDSSFDIVELDRQLEPS